jgi:hypothetical protein
MPITSIPTYANATAMNPNNGAAHPSDHAKTVISGNTDSGAMKIALIMRLFIFLSTQMSVALFVLFCDAGDARRAIDEIHMPVTIIAKNAPINVAVTAR